MADRIVVMKDGKIQQAATPREVYERPANLFVAGFVGSPAMNFLPARGRADGRVVVDGYELSTVADIAALGDQPLTVGMRATDLAINPPEGAENRLQGTIKRVEYAGPDTFFDVALNDAAAVRVRGESRHSLSVGNAVTIACAPTAVHVFAADGQRVFSRG